MLICSVITEATFLLIICLLEQYEHAHYSVVTSAQPLIGSSRYSNKAVTLIQQSYLSVNVPLSHIRSKESIYHILHWLKMLTISVLEIVSKYSAVKMSGQSYQ